MLKLNFDIVFRHILNLITKPVSYTHLRAHETEADLVCRLLLEKNDSDKLPSDIVFEQSPDQLLDSLLPLYLQNQVLRALQESAASELACRMTAMNNASDNAKELASTLNLTYNKARQAAITQEILEVVGGSAV